MPERCDLRCPNLRVSHKGFNCKGWVLKMENEQPVKRKNCDYKVKNGQENGQENY